MPAISFIHPRDEILAAMERIYSYRMTTTSGGNISIREPNGDIWITPARVDKGALRREDIVCVRAGGKIEGVHPPSSEFPFHKAIYEARPDLGGIVHAHPVALVAFSIVRQVPDTRLFHQARHVCGEAGFAPYCLPGSEALGTAVAREFARGPDCIILENHGVITGGATLGEAFNRFETLEFTARTVIRAKRLGGVRYLTDPQLTLARSATRPLDAAEPVAPSSAEKELRRTLCEFVLRAYRQRLFISTQGSFSARLDGSSFLITPYQVDRGSVEAGDLVLVRNGRAASSGVASRAAPVHHAIYAQHPSFGAIINAYPVNATAFSVSGANLDTRTIPESYVVLRQVAYAAFGAQFENPNSIAEMISPQRPVLLLENDGLLVAGSTILEAFDRLEVLESTAEAIIDAEALGPLSHMPESAIEELERAFLKTSR
jgi:L-fuculose-phosphate aldolase